MLSRSILIAMNPISNWKTVLIGGACVTIINKITVRILRLVTSRKRSDEINEVLFYGTGDDNERKLLGLNNLYCLRYVLLHAHYTIDVSISNLDSDTMFKCFINVHEKNNTQVRIVVHKNLDFDLKAFYDTGVQVKVMNRTDVPLEHEFALIDAVDAYEESLAVLGSLDYEVRRLNCDSDSTILTSDKVVVTALKREFDRIWDSIANIE